jgi:hypothetical protein
VLIYGAVAELADAADLKSADRDILWVQVPPALHTDRQITKTVAVCFFSILPPVGVGQFSSSPVRFFAGR